MKPIVAIMLAGLAITATSATVTHAADTGTSISFQDYRIFQQLGAELPYLPHDMKQTLSLVIVNRPKAAVIVIRGSLQAQRQALASLTLKDCEALPPNVDIIQGQEQVSEQAIAKAEANPAIYVNDANKISLLLMAHALLDFKAAAEGIPHYDCDISS